MTRQWILAVAVALAMVSCTTGNASRTALELHVGGRTVAATREGRVAFTYSWPGVYFEARFTGSTVDVEIDDDANELYLYVDENLQLILPRAGRRSITLNALGAGEHTVRLQKTSETQGPTGTFLGFYVPSADRALPPPEYEHAIEFIGDSYTVGYGDTATGRDCSETEVRETTDTSLAFGPLVARYFRADYRVLASSGFGVVRNYANGHPGFTMPVLYERDLYDVEAGHSPDDWHPDVIVIALGINDFSTPLGDDEAWENRESLRADFRATYVEFVERLHRGTPSANFVLLAPRAFDGEILQAVTAVHAELAKRGYDNVTLLPFDGLDLEGCHYHPSVADHGQLASLLIRKLSGLPAP